ncbi:ABC transporter ATP-binding protein [Actinocorallia sp. API 0066]|uniref:ABC transporter ATP-binding protein n=1 Tax=Actinocorallia sp. API 0066 TaxID=2896846 RepID=UPI001E3DBA14|nr:ABC transporter ATP-binding protein [Actinocorallia sp. API 0066]MCD0453505.1 ABC transporter ATP-binding protein [Actinocorallia sp. API 0066]
MKPVAVRLDAVSWAPAGLSGISFDVAPGETLGLLGPNGSGKSSLLRCVYRHVRPSSGAVLVDGADVWRTPARLVARMVAAVTQDVPGDLDTTVEQVVSLGRLPYLGTLGRLGRDDLRLVREAMERCDVTSLARRRMATLSGGERKRVQVARALAQRPRLLVLDEPTNHLDPHHQVALFRLLADLDVTVLIALHDLNLAAATCDRLAVLHHGRLTSLGSPAETLTPALLSTVYRVSADVTPSPTGPPTVTLHLPERPSRGRNVTSRGQAVEHPM